jgi:chromosome segregation ATPase
MPETIPEMIERVKPIVQELFKKINMIDDKIVDLTAARNKISNTGVTHPTVISQIEAFNNLISSLTSFRSRIHNQLRELSDAMKKHKIIGGGLDIDISELMTSINEYLDELTKLDNQNMTVSELDKLEDKLKALSYAVTDRIDDIDVTVAKMSGGKKRKMKKTKKINKKSKKTKKINKKSRKSRKH